MRPHTPDSNDMADLETTADAAFTRAFARERDALPEADDAARIDAAITRALAARSTAAPQTGGRNATTGSGLRARPMLMLLAATLVIGAAAYASLGSEPKSVRSTAPHAPATPAAAPTEAVTPKAAPSPSDVIADVPAVQAPTVAPTPAPPPRALDGQRAKAPPAATERTAAELFAQANAARRDGNLDSAIADYRTLERRYPSARETSTARIALGRLLLERRNDPRSARALFDAYLAESPDGTLAEEARVGRALASKSLGDDAGERAAWEELLRAHPASVNAARAKERLEALSR